MRGDERPAPRTRNGTIVQWPNGFKAHGEIRSQFSHVIDATVLDVSGIPELTFVHGVQQMPRHGRCLVPTFDAADAPDDGATRYFEMLANRGVDHKGWTAVTRHGTPWLLGRTDLPACDDDVGEFCAPEDWSQAHDLAAEMAEKLHELQRLFLIEAARYGVLPLDDRAEERFNPDLAGRPQLIGGNTQLLFGGMGRLTENTVLNVRNKSPTVTAEIEVPAGRAEGLTVAERSAVGASAFGRAGPRTATNRLGLQRFKCYGEQAVPAGKHEVRMEFTHDGGGLGKGGDAAVYLDGEQDGQSRVEATEPMIFSMDETRDVGSNTATPVSDDCGRKTSEFSGRVQWVQLDLGDDAGGADHLMSPEERLRVAMARQ